MPWTFGMYNMRYCGLGALLLAVWLCRSLLPAGAEITDPSEVDALWAVKSRLVDPDKLLDDWKKGDPCLKNWTGVICFDGPLDDGHLHVQELLLLNKNLSGTLAPELGQLTRLEILDFMWNNISGTIPKELGSLKSLKLLLLNGNQLTGSLPEELGYLPKLNRMQVDENQISGPIPKSFANLNKIRHFHMNNNTISGQLPPELSRLPNVMHLLLDNNNLSGYLPPQFSELPRLRILQLDNNNFSGSHIPASYGNMPKLLKLSLRNCSLEGPMPDLSMIPELGYLDLSWNQLNGPIPSNRLSENITTIYLANNNLSGVIPTSLSGLPLLQRLSLNDNYLGGSFPSTLWVNVTLGGNRSLILNVENNLLSNVTGQVDPPANVTVMLRGNPVCKNANELNIVQFCGSQNVKYRPGSTGLQTVCPLQACPSELNYEYVPDAPDPCFCAAPIRVGYRLKSPGFADFVPYVDRFEAHLTRDLDLFRYQLNIDSFVWDKGPRLRMYLKFYPPFYNESMKSSSLFNESEIKRISGILTCWAVPESPIFGPYELLNFTLLPPYISVPQEPMGKQINKNALAGILVGSIIGAIAVSSILTVFIMRRQNESRHSVSKKRLMSRVLIKIDGVKDFTYGEMALATSNFCHTAQVGQGGYGKVYRGVLADGTIVAIKRAQEGSLQGEKEFLTEIELLSRVHHRNLVALLGYCDEEGEQMLVYEFMSNGTLRDHLSGKSKEPLCFAMRLRIALGAAKGIHYLHAEADPPIFHRDIKASNILLDKKFTAKVADFGLSRLAPVTDEESAVLGISTVVKGTPGYLDPEYFLTHKLTDKSDVYSLGIVFLELLTGMHPIQHGKNIVREVKMAYQSGMVFSIVDSRMGSYPSECIEQFVTLALQCCQDETHGRPSMAEVVRRLEQIWRIMPKSDISNSESTTTDSEMSVGGVSLSSGPSTDPFISHNVSGSNLVSGVYPTIRPR